MIFGLAHGLFMLQMVLLVVSTEALQLHVPLYCLSTAGRRSSPVAASIFWNTLPDDMQSAPSIFSFW